MAVPLSRAAAAVNHSVMALVSVIIPTHNRAHLVVDAVESVLQQEGVAFELIVVDDGSSDDTAARLRAYGERLRYVRQRQRGVSSARNHGVRIARGDWLAFLDSDDQWLRGKLATQRAFHRAAQGIPISQTEEIWVRDGQRINQRAHHHRPVGEFFLASLRRCLVSASAVMISRELFEAVGGFDESLDVCEDYDLWLRIAQHARIGLIRQPFVTKRAGHGDQLSDRYWGMDRFRVAALTRLLATNELDLERRRAVAQVVTEKCTILAQGARRRQREDEADRYVALAEVCARV